ncbi:cell wall-binding repeat-containing protein [Euzebya rosea]|uniref:cell wall-binding repeat-containing protein n=1 Tax=Euzebya rosea TaxID=2052804 RepID=UPI000D3E8B6C|nr:cell wall-binding repeat-containing protein [Euzebya rosea]
MASRPSASLLTTIATGLAVLLALLVAPASAQGTSGDERVADTTDPTAASIQISERFFDDDDPRITSIAIGRSNVFADNLGGSSWANAVGRGPLLLNPTDRLDGAVRLEIERLLPLPSLTCDEAEMYVTILGGPAAISATVEDEIRNMGYCVARLAGSGRVETSLEIARTFDDVSSIFLARDNNPADSAAAGGLAGLRGQPIVVNPLEELHPAVHAFILERRVDNVTILGGTAAISQAVEDQLVELGVTVTRLAGPSRAETSARVASEIPTPSIVGLVNGFNEDGWAYSLAAGAVGGRENMSIVYGNETGLVTDVQDYLGMARPGKIITFGPQSAIPDSVSSAARAAAGGFPEDDGVIGTIQVTPSGSPLPITACEDRNTVDNLIRGTYAAGDGNLLFEFSQDVPNYTLRFMHQGELHTGVLNGNDVVTDRGYSGTFTTSTPSGASTQATVEIPDRFDLPSCDQDGAGDGIGTIEFDASGTPLPITACEDRNTVDNLIRGTYADAGADLLFELSQDVPNYTLRVMRFGELHTGTLHADDFTTANGYDGTFTTTSPSGASTQATVVMPDRFALPACESDSGGTGGVIGTVSINATEPRDITACWASPSKILGTYFDGANDQFFALDNVAGTYTMDLDINFGGYSGSLPANELEQPDGALNGLFEVTNGVDNAFAFLNIESPGTVPDCTPGTGGQAGAVGTVSINATQPRDITACWDFFTYGAVLSGTYFDGAADQFFVLSDLYGTSTYALELDIANVPYDGSLPASEFEQPDSSLNGLFEVTDGVNDAFAFVDIPEPDSIGTC